jgi:4-amino-4-deoxychorismate lyase
MTLKQVVLVGGEFEAGLPADDRGLQYGDGVFRTLRVVDGQVCWWDEHIAKLTDDCARIGLHAPDQSVWLADIARIPELGACRTAVDSPLMPPGTLPLTSPKSDELLGSGVLKLLVTRGGGPRGYLPPAGQAVRRVLYFNSGPLPSYPASGLTLRICELRLGWQPRLAGIKHLNRLENVMARAEWANMPNIHEGILLDQADHVVSGVSSNLFVWQGQRLLTPRLDRCGVAGVARDRLMRLAKQQGIEVKETELNVRTLLDADEVMLTNSVMGLRRVARLDSKYWPDPLISPLLTGMLDA